VRLHAQVAGLDLDVVALPAFDRQREVKISDEPRTVRTGGEHDLAGSNDATRRPELRHPSLPAADLEASTPARIRAPASVARSATLRTNSSGSQRLAGIEGRACRCIETYGSSVRIAKASRA
jgi:hypothetical protein